ncbi:isoamyl acetate-hydrolyzing esterase 1 homolog [Actinia tenebrosa]|uniref:Isoamyl acetate-hydrolyzing esterase 1 homolog n=1 Tax=Actinia tenebrosa TaxID=6105 RepID=A0A6P8H620_ACTTE|nr:isoamyl acetate-hydrolyzing esterase 1 homolog [Actinia tenebrosa]
MAVEMRFPKLVLFGDSITQSSFSNGGWGAVLADYFQRKCDVLNRGFSGYTSAYMNKLVLPSLLQHDLTPKESLAAVVILLGSNDACLEGKDERSLTIDEYVSNMNSIISKFVNHGLSVDRIVVMTPPPINEEMWAKECVIKGREMNLSSSRTRSFAKACADLCAKLGVEVIDLNGDMPKEENWSRYVSDGLHLSGEGNQFVAYKLIPVLEAKLGHLPQLFPEWKDIDPKQPEKHLGEDVSKNRTYAGNSRKIEFSHILALGRP